MSNDEYQRRVTVGQAMNMAHSWILKFDIQKDAQTGRAMVSMDGYKKLLEQRTQEFKAMIESVQQAYATAQQVVAAIPEQTIAPPQPTTQQYNFK